MAKFQRKINRQKKEFEFTKKAEVKEMQVWKKTLSFYWIPREWASLLIVILNFLLVTIVAIPQLMTQFQQAQSLLLGHGILTSLFIVMSFYVMEDKANKTPIKELIMRYFVVAIVLLLFSSFAIWVL
jgi:hypothetical protein